MGGRRFNPLLGGVACAVATACVGIAAFHIGFAARADFRIYQAFGQLSDGDVYVVARNVTNVVAPERFVVLVAFLLAIAALRRRWRSLLGTLVVVVGANLTTHILKPLTAAERFPPYLEDAAWPSGHVTAMTTLALCLVVVAPPALSAAATAVAAVLVVAMAYSILLIGTHLPSDVLAAMLVAGMWTALAIAAMQWPEDRRSGESEPISAPRRWQVVAPVVGVAAAVALGALISRRPRAVLEFVLERATFSAGALVIVLVAVGLVAATSLAAQAPRRLPR